MAATLRITNLLHLALLMNMAVICCYSQPCDEIIKKATGTRAQHPNDDLVVLEYDMLFTKQEYEEIKRTSSAQRKRRKALRDSRHRWIQGTVPYDIDNGFSTRDINIIRAAMAEWERYTCLQFRPYRSGDRNYVSFRDDSGCSSKVGRRFYRRGSQPINLARGCRYEHIIVHEIGHAIGFWHEQSRPDRLQYIRILEENIEPLRKENFMDHGRMVDTMGVAYDYKSIMHYGPKAFSRNNLPTIETLDRSMQNIIGMARKLSFHDIKLANLMYECSDHCRNPPTCPSDGFLSKDCKCLCLGNPTKTCNPPSRWSPWTAWGSCSLSCGRGSYQRTRRCIPSNGNCQGDRVQTRSCRDRNCPIVSQWTRWTSWGSCSKTCSGGVQSRSRRCVPSSDSCHGDRTQTKSCVNTVCPTGTACGVSHLTSATGRLTSPNYPNNYPSNAGCKWTIQVLSGRITLTFTTLETENCPFDHVSIYDGSTEASTRLGRFCGTAIPAPVKSTGNRMLVVFISDATVNFRGFRATYQSTPASTRWSSWGQWGTCSVTCARGTRRRTRRCIPSSGICHGDTGQTEYCQKRDCPIDPRWSTWGKWGSCSVTCAHGSRERTRRCVPSTGNCRGSNTNTQLCALTDCPRGTDCGNNRLTSSTGTLSSPNYPGNYPEKANCRWTIRVGSGVITLTFTALEMENCDERFAYDYVDVHDGSTASSRKLGRFCGTTIPEPVRSTGSSMLVMFKSDSSVQFGGFKANYRSTSTSSTACGASQLTSATGRLTSPNYPNNYPHNADCKWTITVPSGRITLTFTAFETENCPFDYVTIYDGHTDSYRRLAKLCGSNLPVPVRSSGNKMLVQFVSDSSFAKSGFRATY